MDGSLPSEDWVHFALQLRPDGVGSVFLNRQMVFQTQGSPLLELVEGWHIWLNGKSVNTELLVRNLTLWIWERFFGEEWMGTTMLGGVGTLGIPVPRLFPG